jgi:hypothetical protein
MDFLGGVISFVSTHGTLVFAILAVGGGVVGAWWVSKKLLELLNPSSVSAVHETVKAWRKTARSAKTVGMPRELWTGGNARSGSAEWGRVRGLTPKAAFHVVLIRPARGSILRFFQRRVVMVANHLVGDTRADVLIVRALGLSQHGEVWWPDDDLTHSPTREAWRAILAREEAEPITDEQLPILVPRWYARQVELDVLVNRAVTSTDNISRNLTVAMAEDLDRAQPKVEEPDTGDTSQEVSALAE